MRITFIVSNCRYISANMHYGSHISWGWSSTECIWTSCQAPQFFSWCDSRNFLHLWGQNHRRILCWPWSRLSTVSCVRSSLRIWGKKTRETSKNISFRKNKPTGIACCANKWNQQNKNRTFVVHPVCRLSNLFLAERPADTDHMKHTRNALCDSFVDKTSWKVKLYPYQTFWQWFTAVENLMKMTIANWSIDVK